MPALDPLPNNGSQLERATRAWLISATSENNPSTQGRLEKKSIFVTNDSRNRDASNGIITLLARESSHDPESEGNEVWKFDIHVTFPAANNNPGQSNPELNRVLIDRITGLVDAAMRQASDDVPGRSFNVTAAGITTAGRALKVTGTSEDKLNNSDMDAFTCIMVRFIGSTRGHPVDGDGNMDRACWVEGRMYEITSCASNVD